MLVVALYEFFWLTMGSLALDTGPLPKIYIVNLVEAPAYLSAAVAWKRPWVAELIAGLTVAAIFAKVIPWTSSPFQRELCFEWTFVVAANVAFFAGTWLHRTKMKPA
jgi:hypothetical protein